MNKKVAVVTGSSKGIGKAIAVRLAAEGALVAAHYGERRDDAEETVRQIETAGGQAFALGANLKQPDAIRALFADLKGELAGRGHDAVDILVNNAGVGPQVNGLRGRSLKGDGRADQAYGRRCEITVQINIAGRNNAPRSARRRKIAVNDKSVPC